MAGPPDRLGGRESHAVVSGPRLAGRGRLRRYAIRRSFVSFSRSSLQRRRSSSRRASGADLALRAHSSHHSSDSTGGADSGCRIASQRSTLGLDIMMNLLALSPVFTPKLGRPLNGEMPSRGRLGEPQATPAQGASRRRRRTLYEQSIGSRDLADRDDRAGRGSGEGGPRPGHPLHHLRREQRLELARRLAAGRPHERHLARGDACGLDRPPP